MKNIKSAIKDFFCGGVIGASMLLPGVSGGTSAIIMGIYDKLIKAVSGLFSDFKRNAVFLFTVAAGGCIGVAVLSGLILNIVNTFYVQSMYFFVGAILGSIPLMIRKAKISAKNIYYVLFSALGVILAVGIGTIPSLGSFSGNGTFSEIPIQILCGFIIAIALILPGISTSHILLVLGMYEPILNALRNLDIFFILPIFVGGVIGIFACTKILDKAMERFPQQTFMIITGFVMASVYDIFPGAESGMNMVICIILSLIGFCAVVILSFCAAKGKTETFNYG